MKAAFFLDIAGKMQSLSLLRLIEKFAEIHRHTTLNLKDIQMCQNML